MEIKLAHPEKEMASEDCRVQFIMLVANKMTTNTLGTTNAVYRE